METEQNNIKNEEKNSKNDKEINENYDFKNRKDVPYIEKENGDIKFKEKNFDEALRHYSKAIMSIKILLDDKVLTTEEEIGKYVKEVGIPSQLRLSICYLKKEDWKNVIYYCNKVLDLETDNEKSLYRRCHAYIKLQQFEKAAEDLKALENLIQGQREFEDLKKMYEEAREAARTDESLLYKKMFKKSENNGEINATKTNFKKEGLISKLPQFVKSLFKLSINWTIIYPAQKCLELARLTSDIFVFRPINFTFQNTKSMLKMSFSLINKYNPFAPNN